MGVVVLTFLQIRNMREIGCLAIVGVITILVPCTIILVKLLCEKDRTAMPTEWVARNSSLVDKGVGVMDVVFAYAGQVIFVELQSDMADHRDFPKAVNLSVGVMALVYAVVASVGYVYIGAAKLADGRPLTSYVSGITLRVVNGLLAIHVLIAYVIEGNVLLRNVLSMLGRSAAVEGECAGPRTVWLLASSLLVAFACASRPSNRLAPPGPCLLNLHITRRHVFTFETRGGFSFVVSSLVPFFSDVMAFFSSLCSVALTYTFPLAIALKLLHLTPITTRCYFILAVVSVAFAAAGTSASVASIVSGFTASAPFACDTGPD